MIVNNTVEAEHGVCAPSDIVPTINATALKNTITSMSPPPKGTCSATNSRNMARTQVKLITTDNRKRHMGNTVLYRLRQEYSIQFSSQHKELKSVVFLDYKQKNADFPAKIAS